MESWNITIYAQVVNRGIQRIFESSNSAVIRGSEEEIRRLNKLIEEKSPYLLQHAKNPVSWFPWGEEAFKKARNEDKPIFLSIGYSTCHWCHVMEKESFDDESVAELMNRVFVSIKVDREERPDLDNIYMTACRLMTGGGGWPLTIMMTPDKKPFFAATYIPKESRYGRPGLVDLIPKVEELWRSRKDELLADAEKAVKALEDISINTVSGNLDESVLAAAFEGLKAEFDNVNGGFGRVPKFPTPHNLLFLLRYWKRSGEQEALNMVERTLQAMRRGGIFDHVGYGFHRYSTDASWLVPHYEKMLYDQALLLMAYTEAYQATGHKEYEDTARGIIAYVIRDMHSPEGAFYSAEDADSEGEEGKFYLWTKEEIGEVLGSEREKLIIDIFNVEADGNFIDQETGGKTGLNILHREEKWSEISSRYGVDESELKSEAESSLRMLYEARSKRVRPFKDDKMLTDWNGLMIAALSMASRVFADELFARAAKRAADFILREMRTQDGRLLHRYRDGEAGLTANIDDYAFLIFGLIELYETTFDPEYLEEAVGLNELIDAHFRDVDSGGFFFTPDFGEPLPVRQMEIYDGAIPSGNSIAAHNLLRLSRLTGNLSLENRAAEIFSVFSENVKQGPTAYTFLLSAFDFYAGPSCEIVIVEGDESTADKMINPLNRLYYPNKIVILKSTGDGSDKIEKLAPFIIGQVGISGKSTTYVCRDFACKLPTTDPDEMIRMIEDIG